MRGELYADAIGRLGEATIAANRATTARVMAVIVRLIPLVTMATLLFFVLVHPGRASTVRD
jgi:hypothetical protein